MHRAKPRIVFLALLAINAAVGFWVYSQVQHHSFLGWDDLGALVHNPHLHGFNRENVWWLLTAPADGIWMPVTYLSFLAEFSLPLSTGSHLLINPMLHGINAALVGMLVYRIAERRFVRVAELSAVLASVLFLLHPVNIEAAVWFSGRKEVMCAFFYLLACLSWWQVRADPAHQARWKLFAWAALIAALCSKPMAISLPVIFVFIDLLFEVPFSWREHLVSKWCYWLPCLIMIPVAIWAQHVSDALPDLSASTLSVRLAQLVDSYVFYLWHFVVPINLFPHYPSYSAIGIPGMTTLGESLVVLLLVWYASWCYRHEHLAACLAVCWFLVVFFPVSGWMQIGTHRMADRYAYLPLVSLCGLAAICLAEIIQRCRWMLVVVMAMIMMMAVLSSRQVAHWQSDRSLWEYAQREQTDNALASSNLAGVYLQLGETDKAVQLLQQAADREPHVKTHVMAWIDICMMLKRWPCVDQAIEVGLQRFPEDKRFVIRAGDADMLQQRWVLAEQQYRAALGFNPANLVLYRKIGEVYVQQYRYPDAAAVLKQMVDHAEDKASAASQAAKLMELWCSQRPAGMTVQPCSQH